MRWCGTVLIAASLLATSSATEDKGKGKTDLAPAETRVPLLPYGGYEGLEPGLGYGAAPGYGGYGPGYGAGLGHLEQGPALGHPGVPLTPYAQGLGDGMGYNGGYLKGGLHEGGLGNHGSDYYRGGSDGRYADGSFHEGGRLSNGGYQGVTGYRDDKHHIADDHANKAYYNDAHGSRKDLGNGQVFDKNQDFSQNAYNSLGNSELSGHDKGHHRTGFKKSYHKDESGNDESFYDTDHDEGNRALGKKYGDAFGTNFATKVNGAHNVNEFDANNVGREGYEGNGKLVALNQGLKDYYGQNKYYNNGNKYGSLGQGQSSDYGNYGVGHGYQDGYHNGRDLGYNKFGRNSYYSPY